MRIIVEIDEKETGARTINAMRNPLIGEQNNTGGVRNGGAAKLATSKIIATSLSAARDGGAALLSTKQGDKTLNPGYKWQKFPV